MNKYKRIAGLLTGILAGITVALMGLGGFTSLSPFLQEGNVYDFSKGSLTASGSTWIYDEENEYFTLASKKAIKRFSVDEGKSGWNFLYLTVDKLSVPELPVELRCYDQDYEILSAQELTLVAGENVIVLNPEIVPVRIGFYVKRQEGVNISFSSMQMREKARGEYAADEFVKIAVAVSGLVLLFEAVVVRVRRRRAGKRGIVLPGALPEYVYLQMERIAEKLIGGRKSSRNQRSALTLLFSLLFFWCIFTSALGWNADSQMYRYQVLGCMVLLSAAGGFCVGKAAGGVRWDTPVAVFWVLFWITTMISDFFAGGKFHFYGYGMLLAGGFFIYQWSRMDKPRQMFEIWRDALEIVFFLSIFFCLLFRPKLLAVQYNGVFADPRANAMFALLALVTFAADAEQWMRRGQKGGKIAVCFVGMALAVYLVFRAEEKTGWIAAGLLGILFLVRIAVKHQIYFNWVRGNVFAFAGAIVVSALVSVGFHMGIKVLPEALGTSLEYKNDVKSSREPEEILDALAAVNPSYVKGIVTKMDASDAANVRMAYVRELSLLGNGEGIRVSGKAVSADCGYLSMVYRYGIFILVPFLMYQIAVLQAGLSGLLSAGEDGGRDELWISGVMVIYVVFSVSGASWLCFAHPLWMCAFVGSGFWFQKTPVSGFLRET